MGYPVVFEKHAASAAGAITAAFAEAGLSPATALLFRVSETATDIGVPRSAGLAMSLAFLVALSAVAQGYVRPLSRKAGFATGFCVVAVAALLVP